MGTLDPQLLQSSESLAAALEQVLRTPKYDESPRVRVSSLACALSVEHSHAARRLLALGLVPSALVVLRAQYEALVRAIWVLYAASDAQVGKLQASLDSSGKQAAKNLPLVQDMLTTLATKAPPQAYQVLSNFKDSSWKALNSYVHAGLHPIQRHETGHQLVLVEQVLKNSNGLGLVAGMQSAVLTGDQQLARHVGTFQELHRACLPQRDEV